MAANCRISIAAHVVVLLATHEDELVSSSAIAYSVNTNPVVIRRILIELQEGGIVETRRGKAGGSKLRRRPRDIKLWDLALALSEDHLFAIYKNPTNRRCEVACRMKESLAEAFGQAEAAAQAALKRISIAHLLSKEAP